MKKSDNFADKHRDRARRMLAELKNNKTLAEKISLAIQSMHQEHDQLIEKIERDVD